MPSWEDLEKTKRPDPNIEDAEDLCARVFSSPDGLALLELLRERYIERALPFTVPESALRAFEGQRQLVRELEALRMRGLAKLKKKTG